MNLYQTIRSSIRSSPNYEEGELITFLNPYSYLVARKSVETFGKFERVYIDGMMLVWFLKLTGISNLKRNSFDYTSMGKKVLEGLNSNQQSVYIIGTTSINIEKAIKNIKTLYPPINVIGFRHGYFKNDNEMISVIQEIVSLNPSFLIVGMGTPMQEIFLVKMRDAGWKGTGFTCGGFLHQAAKNVVYYPRWVDKMDIRWIYRIWDEPKLIKRYFVWYPISIIVLVKDMLFK